MSHTTAIPTGIELAKAILATKNFTTHDRVLESEWVKKDAKRSADGSIKIYHPHAIAKMFLNVDNAEAKKGERFEPGIYPIKSVEINGRFIDGIVLERSQLQFFHVADKDATGKLINTISPLELVEEPDKEKCDYLKYYTRRVPVRFIPILRDGDDIGLIAARATFNEIVRSFSYARLNVINMPVEQHKMVPYLLKEGEAAKIKDLEPYENGRFKTFLNTKFMYLYGFDDSRNHECRDTLAFVVAWALTRNSSRYKIVSFNYKFFAQKDDVVVDKRARLYLKMGTPEIFSQNRFVIDVNYTGSERTLKYDLKYISRTFKTHVMCPRFQNQMRVIHKYNLAAIEIASERMKQNRAPRFNSTALEYFAERLIARDPRCFKDPEVLAGWERMFYAYYIKVDEASGLPFNREKMEQFCEVYAEQALGKNLNHAQLVVFLDAFKFYFKEWPRAYTTELSTYLAEHASALCAAARVKPVTDPDEVLLTISTLS